MPFLTGSLRGYGPMVDIKVMQTNQRVEALKKAGRKFSSPTTILGLIGALREHSTLILGNALAIGPLAA
jgi:hypothetical protein